MLSEPDIGRISHLFLVGGFAESSLLQEEIRSAFSDSLMVVIPQGLGVAVLKGAVMYGLDPAVITTRRAKLTYGIGVIVPFKQGIHPIDKLVVRKGQTWCLDVLDVFVRAGHSVSCGDCVVRWVKSLQGKYFLLCLLSGHIGPHTRTRPASSSTSSARRTRVLISSS